MRRLARTLPALLATGCVTQASPSPRVAAVSVTGPGYHNETSVAVNPARPRSLLAAWQIPATVGWSDDGGATWSSAVLPGTDAFQMSGDPSVLFDADGAAYALYIAFDRPADYDTLGRAAHRNGIYINRSDDGGRTWRPQGTAVAEQPERPGIPFEDKPMAVADRSADPARRGHLYVAWTEFRRMTSVILFSRSTDGARTFSPPVEISDRTGSPKDTVGAAEGTSLAVGPDGTVYVVWSDSLGIWLDRSRDGGRTFGTDRLVARTADIVFGVPGVERANGYPNLAVDPRSGRMYVSWADVRLGSPALFLVTSDDGGATWTAPREVGGRTAGDAAARFFSWMALDPRTGGLALGYYRAEPGGRARYEVAWSADGGTTFTRRPWGASFDPRGEFLGDYTGVDALGGTVFGAWTEVAPPAPGAAEARGTHHARVVVGTAAFPSSP
jgi:hypothetical protein